MRREKETLKDITSMNGKRTAILPTIATATIAIITHIGRSTTIRDVTMLISIIILFTSIRVIATTAW